MIHSTPRRNPCRLYSHLAFTYSVGPSSVVVKRTRTGSALSTNESAWSATVTCQWSGRILGITGWDPSVCKSNRSHVDTLQFSFIKLRYILEIPLKWSVIFLQSWTSTGYFSNSTGSSVTSCRFSPIIVTGSLSLVCEVGLRVWPIMPRNLPGHGSLCWQRNDGHQLGQTSSWPTSWIWNWTRSRNNIVLLRHHQVDK